MTDMFPVAGAAPKVKEVKAIAFHDGSGRIYHMHHSIVLEGADPVSEDVLAAQAREEAKKSGVDVSKLTALRVTNVGDPHVMHRVDVKTGELVELTPPQPFVDFAGNSDPADNPHG